MSEWKRANDTYYPVNNTLKGSVAWIGPWTIEKGYIYRLVLERALIMPEVTFVPVGDEYAYEKTMDAPFLTEKRSGPGFGTTETVFIPAGTYEVTYRRLPDPEPVEPQMGEDEIAMWVGKGVISGMCRRPPEPSEDSGCSKSSVEMHKGCSHSKWHVGNWPNPYLTDEEAAREIKRRMSK